MTSHAKPVFNLDIDIVGSCNLRCPSCPVGNAPELRTRSGVMSRDLLEAILDKALAECQLSFVSLFNWTEPFLHPRLADMIRAVRSRGLPCALSSNLNVTADSSDVLGADPTLLRVSLSGFRQEVYGKTHRHGNIERVKRNMIELAEAKRSTGSAIDLQVLFHRYVGNHDDEGQMRAFAESLGFKFQPIWAYLMPLEKNLAFLGEADTGTSITAEDEALIESLALRPDEASQAARPYRDQPCVLQSQRLAIDHEGKIQLCCATFDRSRYTIADFLTTPLSEIQRRRQNHSLCGTCVKHGLHVVGVYGAAEFEQVAMRRVRTAFPDVELPASFTPVARKKAEPRQRRRDVLVVKLLKKLAGWPSRVHKKRIGQRAA